MRTAGIILVAIMMLVIPATAFEFDTGIEDRYEYEAQAVPIIWEYRNAGIGSVLFINSMPMNYNEFKEFYYEHHPDDRYHGPYISKQENPRPMRTVAVDEPPEDDGNGNGNGDYCKPPRPPWYPPHWPWPPIFIR